MRVLADPIVDWAAIGKVVLAALIAGVGVAVFFSLAVLGTTRFAEMRRSSRAAEAGGYAVLGLAGFAATVAGIVIAIIVMTTKS